MMEMNFTNLQKLKNGLNDHGSCLPDSDSSSVGTGSELADRDHDMDDPGLGPGFTQLTPDDMANLEKAANRGKKTKGRVKIKMEFIENKLRRYTTFSKRKTGIMKKAYELSTLTGTQVMLLVASETGHVYTFATRKLQPMITSESGKALIQTCLNSPDIPSDSQHHSHNPDQRMCATGFEETDLSYQVSDEEALSGKEGRSTMFQVTQVPGAGADANASTSNGLLSGAGHTFPMTTYIPTSSTVPVTSGTKVSSTTATSLPPMSVPPGATITTLISPTGQALAAGQALQALQVQSNPQLQLQPNIQGQTPAATPTVYRLPQGASLAGTASNPVVTAFVPTPAAAASAATTTTQPTQSANTVTMLTAPQSSMSPAGNSNALATPLMYHAPQGVVYAASPAGTVNTLPDGFFFNYQTAAHLHPTSHETLHFLDEMHQIQSSKDLLHVTSTPQASDRPLSIQTSAKRPGDDLSTSATSVKIPSLEAKPL
ncbi:serum response factor-like isoform X2 [Lytechinus variegatus]|uniref:serum response factor-like isoform X2 n=1 Tax=Lytechinus variegatus TaxID=7654 RepID=UPI001BB14286|nr:serum response factor-like isoform X2 [Lytechinus variegatus]